MLKYHTLFQGQRTVYRLTLVKGWNVEEIKAYSELVALGKPDFIEVKVTRELNVPNIVETLLMDTFLIMTA